jgi:hypothetical protein
LELYNSELIARPSVIFANKIDRRPMACERNLARLAEVAAGVPIVAGSAQNRHNVRKLIGVLHDLAPTPNPW